MQDCLLGYARRVEAEVERKLFPRGPKGASGYQLEFDFGSWLRGDYASTMAGLGAARQWGLMTANEGRRALGLNDIGPEGDAFWGPVNMVNSVKLSDLNYMGAPARQDAGKVSTGEQEDRT